MRRGGEDARSRTFLHLFADLEPRHRIVVLGDAFEECDAETLASFLERLGRHELIFVGGNHDQRLKGMLSEVISISRHAHFVEDAVEIGQIVALHGHQFDWLWRRPVAGASQLALQLFGALDEKTGGLASMALGELSCPTDWIQAQTSWLRSCGGPYLIFGHTHRPFLTSSAANCGSWEDARASTFVLSREDDVFLLAVNRGAFFMSQGGVKTSLNPVSPSESEAPPGDPDRTRQAAPGTGVPIATGLGAAVGTGVAGIGAGGAAGAGTGGGGAGGGGAGGGGAGGGGSGPRRSLGPLGTWIATVTLSLLGLVFILNMAQLLIIEEVANLGIKADNGQLESFGRTLHGYVVVALMCGVIFSLIYLLYKIAHVGGGVEAATRTESVPLLGTPRHGIRIAVTIVLFAYAIVALVAVLASVHNDGSDRSAIIVVGLLAVAISAFLGLSGVMTGANVDPVIRSLSSLGQLALKPPEDSDGKDSKG